LLAPCSEKSWKIRPVIKSFLDCAEIAVAVSLSYDWLYDEFSGEERLIIEESLLRHVLEPAVAAYRDKFTLWPRRRDNCALVSNSGILVASLAVLKRYPGHTAELIRKSLLSSWRIFEALAPDGAWPEGPSYWSLAMRYAGLMVAALESSLGQSFGLASRPGFAQTGDFALHTVGPFGAAFNFADSEERLDVSALAWFAHRFQRTVDARLVQSYEGWYLPFMAIWAKRPRGYRKAAEPPTGKGLSQWQSRVFSKYLVERPGSAADLSCYQGRKRVQPWRDTVVASRRRDSARTGGRRKLYHRRRKATVSDRPRPRRL